MPWFPGSACLEPTARGEASIEPRRPRTAESAADTEGEEPAADMTVTPKCEGDELLGRWVRKKFPRHGWFSGMIVDYDAETHWYGVVFTDGDR